MTLMGLLGYKTSTKSINHTIFTLRIAVSQRKGEKDGIDEKKDAIPDLVSNDTHKF